MVKVTGPLFSVSQSGTIADAIEILKWRSSSFTTSYLRATMGKVRIKQFPFMPKTIEVLGTRRTFAAGVSTWHDDSCLSAESRNSWIYFSSGLAMNAFNRYIKKFIENNPQREAPWLIPSPE